MRYLGRRLGGLFHSSNHIAITRIGFGPRSLPLISGAIRATIPAIFETGTTVCRISRFALADLVRRVRGKAFVAAPHETANTVRSFAALAWETTTALLLFGLPRPSPSAKAPGLTRNSGLMASSKEDAETVSAYFQDFRAAMA